MDGRHPADIMQHGASPSDLWFAEHDRVTMMSIGSRESENRADRGIHYTVNSTANCQSAQLSFDGWLSEHRDGVTESPDNH